MRTVGPTAFAGAVLLAVVIGLNATADDQDVRSSNLETVRATSVSDIGREFSGFDLQDQNLSGLDLSYADMTGARLVDANLTNVALIDATLTGADLTGADLRGADITGVILVDATLDGTDLTDAWWDRRWPPRWPQGFAPPDSVRGSVESSR